jgi:ABC-type nitrate/sulfonate/bicarbonate transport system substrate-binding protein
MTWTHAGDTDSLTSCTLSPEDAAIVDDLLDAAQAWADGLLPWYEAAKVGELTYRGVVMPGYTRYIAYTRTPDIDPRREALGRLIERLIAASGWTTGRQGCPA